MLWFVGPLPRDEVQEEVVNDDRCSAYRNMHDTHCWMDRQSQRDQRQRPRDYKLSRPLVHNLFTNVFGLSMNQSCIAL